MQGSHFVSNLELGDFTLTADNGTFNSVANIHVVEAVTEVPENPAIVLSAASPSASEDFDGMGNDAEAGLPAGWRIDRQLSAPRTVGRYDLADTHTMYAGGVNLPSNAKNGTWNFGDNEGTDRALGGISTGVDGGTRCVNVYAHFFNDGRKDLQNLQVTYDVEKYRQGTNEAGFTVQLYYSIDGRNWTSAGEQFRTHFEPDGVTQGYDVVPGATVAVSGTLGAVMQHGCDFYLAWNISVASGSAAQAAMALAIDNVTITGEVPPVPTAKHYIYAEDLTGWASLGLYAWGDSELFGAWPGETWVDEVEFEHIVFKKFLLDVEGGNYHLIFNNWNNGSQLPDYDITADRDYYFTLNPLGVLEVIFDVTAVADVKASTLTLNGTQVVGDGVITVFDMAGRQVAVGKQRVAVDDLPAGIYVARDCQGNSMKLRR